MNAKGWLLRHSVPFLLLLHLLAQVTTQGDGIVVQLGNDDTTTPEYEKGDLSPTFGTENSTVFVFPVGSTAFLPCVIYNLGKHVVTWSRLRDYQLLIIYNRSYTSDERVQISHSEDLQNWTLRIGGITKNDAGFYSCQIPTMSPPQGLFLELQVIDRQSKETLENLIVPQGDKLLSPSFRSENGTIIKVQDGSTGLLPCVVRNVGTYKVVWTRIRDNHILTVHNTTVVLDFRIQGLYLQSSENWVLQIRDVEVKDGGWYKCEVSTTPPMTLFVELEVEDLEQFHPNGNSTQLAHSIPASFGTPNGTFVTFQVGSIALLPCHVYNLDEGVVSWIRHRDYHIVTIGLSTYTNDARFQVVHLEESDNWALQIKYVMGRDAGLYRCQVSSHPTTSIFIQLNVVVSDAEAKAEIVGSSEKFLKLGSRLQLDCYVVESTETPSYVFWYHYDRMVNYDGDRGVNVTTDLLSKSSTLAIEGASTKHSGNYTCAPSNAQPARVFVHVLKGENPAAMQHGTATLSSKSLVWWTVFCVVEIVTFL